MLTKLSELLERHSGELEARITELLGLRAEIEKYRIRIRDRVGELGNGVSS